MQWITCVLQVRRIPRRGNQLFAELSPVRPEEQARLELGNSQVQYDVQVEVVASNGAVDEVLGEREDRQRRDRRVNVGSDVGEPLDGRLQILQISDQVGLSVVDQPVGGVTEYAQAVQSGGQTWPLLDQHVERGR